MKTIKGDCINPPKEIGDLDEVIDEAKEITREQFLNEVCPSAIPKKTLKGMMKHPNSYSYYKNGEVLFYRHSGIEYFFY